MENFNKGSLMNTFEFIFSLQFRIAITIMAMFLYGVITPEANPNDILAIALSPLLLQIKSLIILVLCAYWGISMFVNKILYR